MKEFDIVVIGSGVAGLYFSLQAAEHASIGIITKKELMECNTNYAQGGIAAVIDQATDSPDLHIKDTLEAGAGLCDVSNVNRLVEEGPAHVQRLIEMGVGFNRDHGHLSLGMEGGHSARRIVFAGDATGKAVERALVFNERMTENVTAFESMVAVDLIVDRGRCVGVICLDRENGSTENFMAKAVVLATGGLGQIYANTTNPRIATGDGIGIAYRAGAVMQDMEFVQFHPTTLDKRYKPHFLISEAVRGEGGLLINSEGERFMHRYHPSKELAPRDVVARAILAERVSGPVHLDITRRSSRFIKERFASIFDQLWWYGVRMDREPIPVSPAAHYCCGGVRVDDQGRTSIKGLYALGETACTGVHGANRLASNSLLECLVYSARAASVVTEDLRRNPSPEHEISELPITPKRTDVSRIRRSVRSMMWRNVGIVRSVPGMKRTIRTLNVLHERVQSLLEEGVNVPLLELRNMLDAASLITTAAMIRRESRGVHYLKELPERNDERWKCHILLERDSDPVFHSVD